MRVPLAWLPSRVQTCQDHDLDAKLLEEPAEWTAAQQGPAHLPMDHTEVSWPGSNLVEARTDGIEEFASQAGTIGLVPLECAPDVLGRLRAAHESPTSPAAFPQLLQVFLADDTRLPIGRKRIQSPVKFEALTVGQGYGVGRDSEAVP